MNNKFKNYTIIQEKYEKDVNSNCIYLQHNKTKAKIVLMQNDEENKVFTIFFRTPVDNSKGTPHILEHSVLCGSRKYDLKDPFVELAKGSMKTFLNAFTFADKTGYPVASCNMQDFKNLMDVYLDAVFYPNIYKNKYILMQEGWHYEIEDKNSPITINGVVYNEMKGEYSNPDNVLERTIHNNLFNNTTYGFEYGGDPTYIPTLTNKEFLDFHKKYYHPSNSYIVLYGNMDFEERLEYIDKEYLSKFDFLKVNSSIDCSKSKPIKEAVEYYNLDSVDSVNKDYLSISFRLDSRKSALNNVIYHIFSYYLFEREGAILKEALLKEGIAEDINVSYSNEMKENSFSIIAKNASYKNKNKFIKIIYDTLNKIYKEGFDKNVIEAALNICEFEVREVESGNLPRGLDYTIALMESFLYDENPFIYLEYGEVFDRLRKENKKKNNIFTKLLKEKFIDNDKYSIICLRPKKDLLAKKEKDLAKKLDAAKNKLSNNELNALIKFTKQFKEYQKSEDSPEKIESVPLLKVSDIEPYKEIYTYKEININGQKCIFIPTNVNGITYYKELYEISNFSDEELVTLAIYKYLLGKLDTKNYSFSKLDECLDKFSGGFTSKVFSIDEKVYLAIGFKCLCSNFQQCKELLNEIKYDTKFDNVNRLKKLILEIKINSEDMLQSAGHICAMNRAISNLRKEAHNNELTLLGGISYYQYIKKLLDGFNDIDSILVNNLKNINDRIYDNNSKQIFVSSINIDNVKKNISNKECDKNRGKNTETISKFTNIIDVKPLIKKVKTESFITSSEVNYVALCGNMEYSGELDFIKTLLSYEYLWQNVRVLGGAYGCMSNFLNENIAYYVSYRDPHIKETIDIYKGVYDFLKNLKLKERDINKYIIGTMSAIDNPKSNSFNFDFNISGYLNNKNNDTINKNRQAILNINNEKINNLAEKFKKLNGDYDICAVGSKTEIEKNKNLFKECIKLDV